MNLYIHYIDMDVATGDQVASDLCLSDEWSVHKPFCLQFKTWEIYCTCMTKLGDSNLHLEDPNVKELLQKSHHLPPTTNPAWFFVLPKTSSLHVSKQVNASDLYFLFFVLSPPPPMDGRVDLHILPSMWKMPISQAFIQRSLYLFICKLWEVYNKIK